MQHLYDESTFYRESKSTKGLESAAKGQAALSKRATFRSDGGADGGGCGGGGGGVNSLRPCSLFWREKPTNKHFGRDSDRDKRDPVPGTNQDCPWGKPDRKIFICFVFIGSFCSLSVGRSKLSSPFAMLSPCANVYLSVQEIQECNHGGPSAYGICAPTALAPCGLTLSAPDSRGALQMQLIFQRLPPRITQVRSRDSTWNTQLRSSTSQARADSRLARAPQFSQPHPSPQSIVPHPTWLAAGVPDNGHQLRKF